MRRPKSSSPIVRRYKRCEAAEKLNIPETWLKRWVTARCIPHQRSGDPNGKQQQGVWFTLADILAIGEMLPELMTPRQAEAAAVADAHSAAPDVPESLTADVLGRWPISASAETRRLLDEWRICALQLPRVPCGSGPWRLVPSCGSSWHAGLNAPVRPVHVYAPGERGRERSGWTPGRYPGRRRTLSGTVVERRQHTST